MLNKIKNKITSNSTKQPKDRELKADLQNAADKLGEDENLTAAKYNEIGSYSARSAANKYGSWNQAKQEAGLPISPSTGPTKNYSEDELLQDLKDTAEQVEGKLTAQKYNEHGNHSSATYHQRFGAWSKAKEKAGLDPSGREKKIDDETLREELNKGKTANDIAEEYDYSETSFSTTLSQRLKRKGWYLRNKLSVPSDPNNNSVILSIRQELIEETGNNPTEENVYFEKEVRPEENEIAIKMHEERVGEKEDEDEEK